MASGVRGAKDLVAALVRIVQRERDAMALEIVAELQRRPPDGTPVRTGYARAGWIPVLGPPRLAPVRLNAQGTVLQRSQAMQAAAVDAAARQQAAVATLLSRGASDPHASAHVYNPVVYVNRLNDPGTSPQSPAGWVERSVARAVVRRRALSTSRTRIP